MFTDPNKQPAGYKWGLLSTSFTKYYDGYAGSAHVDGKSLIVPKEEVVTYDPYIIGT